MASPAPLPYKKKTPLDHTALLPPTHTQLPQPHKFPPRHRRREKMSSAVYDYTGCEHDYQPHYLDSCFLCRRTLSHNNDIFMYRGDTPFCSQECRQEQIEMDEAMEKRWKLSSSSSSSSSKRSSSVRQTSDSTDTNKAVRTGTVAVA